MAITRADILSRTESNSADQVNSAKAKITVIQTRDGSAMAPNFFSPVTFSDDQVHCYFPYSNDLLFSLDEMMKKVKEEKPGKQIHHIEVTLSLYNTGLARSSILTKSTHESPSSSVSDSGICSMNGDDAPDNPGNAEDDDLDDDDLWTDISSDEAFSEPEEEQQSTLQTGNSGNADGPLLRPRNIYQKSTVSVEMESKKRNLNKASIKRNEKKCPICGKKVTGEWQLRDHMVSHSSERPFKCPLCGKGFKRYGGMLQHKKIVHSKETHVHTCRNCARRFAYQSHLIKHMAIC